MFYWSYEKIAPGGLCLHRYYNATYTIQLDEIEWSKCHSMAFTWKKTDNEKKWCITLLAVNVAKQPDGYERKIHPD